LAGLFFIDVILILITKTMNHDEQTWKFNVNDLNIPE